MVFRVLWPSLYRRHRGGKRLYRYPEAHQTVDGDHDMQDSASLQQGRPSGALEVRRQIVRDLVTIFVGAQCKEIGQASSASEQLTF